MKTNSKNNSLTKKVLLSVVAAGMMSSFVLSAEAANAQLVVTDGNVVTRKDVTASYVVVKSGAKLTLENSTVSGVEKERTYPNDTQIDVLRAADVAADVRGAGSELTAKNVNFTGEVSAFEGAKISITGGRITSANYYYKPGSYSYSGTVREAMTRIGAYKDAQIELNKVDIKSNLDVYAGGTINVNDSNIDASVSVHAIGENAVLNLKSSDGTATYGKAGLAADDGATINIYGGATILGEIRLANAAKFNIKTGDVELKDNDSHDAGNVDIYTGGEEYSGSTFTTEAGTKLKAKNLTTWGAGSSAVIKGTVDLESVTAGEASSITLNGGKITANLELINEGYGVTAANVEASSLTATNVDFIGHVKSFLGSEVKLTGGSISGYGIGYRPQENGSYALATLIAELPGTDKGEEGKQTVVEADGVRLNANIIAREGGKVIVKNSTIDEANEKNYGGYIEVKNENSVVEISNSNIKTTGLWATDGGRLTLDEKTSAKVAMVEAIKATMELNGDLETEAINAQWNSVITLKGGANTVYKVTDSIAIDDTSKLNIYGGTLEADKLNDLLGKVDTKVIVLDKKGIISTMSDQIYANKASATQQESGAITNEGIDFVGGTLVLNDAKYTKGYLKTGQDELKKQGLTKLVMKGHLVDESGEIKDTISAGEAANIGNDTELDKVTVIGGSNLLIGSNDVATGQDIDGFKVGNSVENGFSAGSMELDAGSDGVIIVGEKALTLGGSEGGTIITVDGTEADVKVVVGLDEATATAAGIDKNIGNLNIGNSMATAATQYKLNGEVVVNDDSNLNVTGQIEITNSLTLNDSMVNVIAGALQTKELHINGYSSLFGAVNAEKLAVAADGLLEVGSDEDAGSLTVNEANLNGGMIFLDPAWQNGATISDASGLAVKNITAADGAYVVGRNSVLSLGADLTKAQAAFARSEQTWGENAISAAAYIDSTLNVASGSLTVDGALENDPTTTPANGSVKLADKSLLMVNGSEINETTAAITGVSSADIAASSKLYIDNAEKDKTYKIIDGVAAGWTAGNILSNNKLLNFTVNADNTVSTTSKSVKDAYGSAVFAADVYDAAVLAGGAAADFVAKVADEHVNATEAAQVSALNSAAALSELAGVERGTYTASNLLTDAVAEHLSLTNEKEHDSDVWAKYIHSKENIDGLAIANFGAKYDAQYNGIVVGADLYKSGTTTVGAALTYVDGNINGNTVAARTKNDATYYGASIYGAIQNEDSAVLSDISYLHGKNDITQYNSGSTLTADAKTDAFSIGVRAEKSVKAGIGRFVPYAGLRYMHLGTGNYTNSIGMSYDGDDMNLWLLPVGVKYSADMKAGAWTLRPIAEVGYVWNMGDREATQTVSLNGVSDGFGFDVADSGSYIGRFVIEAEKANVTYGLGYEYQKGDSVKANRWMANLNMSF